jgi:hypothetical protein
MTDTTINVSSRDQEYGLFYCFVPTDVDKFFRDTRSIFIVLRFDSDENYENYKSVIEKSEGIFHDFLTIKQELFRKNHSYITLMYEDPNIPFQPKEIRP